MTSTLILILFGNTLSWTPQALPTSVLPAFSTQILAFQEDRDPGDTGTGDTTGTGEDIDDSDEGRTDNGVERLPDGFSVAMTVTEQAAGASGEVRYTKGEFHEELTIEVHGLEQGEYAIIVEGVERAVMTVESQGEEGTVGLAVFREPAEFGTHRFDFEFLGRQVEIMRGQLVQMGVLLPQTVDDPLDLDTIDIRVNLIGTGRAPQASGYLNFYQRLDYQQFNVRVGYLPAGNYDLYVDDIHRAVIEVTQVDVTAKGEVAFEDPLAPEKLLLDFDPREKSVEVRQNGETYLTVAFPSGIVAKADDNVAREFTSNGAFSAPTFITGDALSVTQDGRLQVLLPHPNADGWDLAGETVINYSVNVSKDCESLSEFYTVSGNESFPYLLETSFRVSEDDYSVSIGRQAETPVSDLASPALKLNGPTSQAPAMKVSSLDRWLLHTPKQSGGFDGEVLLVNKQPGVAKDITLIGFDINGRALEGAEKLVTLHGARMALALYGDGENALFPAALTDGVSHIGIYEPGDHHGVQAIMKFIHRASGAAGQSVETSLRSGVSGSRFVMNPMKAESIADSWDGLAILNLRCGDSVHVYLSRYEAADQGERLLESRLLGSIAPGGKMLYVVRSEDFPPQAGTWLVLTTGDDDHKIQVLGLSGSSRVLGANPVTRIQ